MFVSIGSRAGRKRVASAAVGGGGMVGGRLTLTSGTPVLTSNALAATTVYFTPYNGNLIPVTLDGVNFNFTAFSELSQATTDTTKSPAAVAASKIYDIFVWNDGGTLRATRGPAWSSDTARGTGAGTTELQLVSGFYTNKNAITNGPGANRGTYVGSVRSNASSQIDFNIGGSASGGTAGWIGIWNNFNRRLVYAKSNDSGVSYSVNLNLTCRQARASAGNQISFLMGLAENTSTVFVGVTSKNTGASGGNWSQMGAGLDATTGITHAFSQVFPTAGPIGEVSSENIAPQLGFHYVSRNENTDNSNCTFDWNSNDFLGLEYPY